MKEGIIVEIIGDRIRIKPIKLEDVYQMKNWGYHKNPLLSDYNLLEMTDEELKLWYKYKKRGFNQIYYSVFNEVDILIGYLGIKNIRRIWKEATLGIVLDPNYINMGYGTEIITNYLDYFFEELNMKTMYLEVAKFNKRAMRCYEKCGFSTVDMYLDKFFNQNLDLESPYYLEESSSFVLRDGRLYNYIYVMKVCKTLV